MTVPEPIRDDETWDRLKLIVCPYCDGKRRVTRERANTTVTRACRECRSGNGRIIQGNPPDDPYCLTLSYGVSP